MKIDRLDVSALEIPFKISFKHASADRAKTASIWVEACTAQHRIVGYGEGCPREYVTGESMKSAQDWINRHQSSIINDISSLDTLKQWVLKHEQAIDKDPAAWCAVELAILDLLGKNEGRSLEATLSLPPPPPMLQYSAVLGDNDEASFSKQVSRYISVGFRDFKIKLSGNLEKDRKKVNYLNSSDTSVRIRGDANNLWRESSEVIDYLNQLGQPFWALEEPLAPRDFDGMSKIASHAGIKIILDESFTHVHDFLHIKETANFWIPNMRISKLGGLIRSIDMIERAHSLGLQIIIGAHVGETSVLTRAGIVLASAAGKARVAMEGAFGTHLLDHDVCASSLMFGKDGIMYSAEWRFLNTPGNGLEIRV